MKNLKLYCIYICSIFSEFCGTVGEGLSMKKDNTDEFLVKKLFEITTRF